MPDTPGVVISSRSPPPRERGAGDGAANKLQFIAGEADGVSRIAAIAEKVEVLRRFMMFSPYDNAHANAEDMDGIRYAAHRGHGHCPRR